MNTLPRVRLLLFGIIGGVCLGCTVTDVTHTATNNSKICNGYVYERGVMMLGGARTLVLPTGTKIERGSNRNEVVFYVCKEQSVFATPSSAISIHDARKQLGIAYKISDNETVVRTLGEVFIDGHGTKKISIAAIIPAEVNVEFRENLSRKSSSFGDVWRSSDEDGWIAIPTTSISETSISDFVRGIRD